MNITLSLIIPVYKVEAYIEACLDSVLQQLPDWAEVIIVDDGSPDGAIGIAEEMLCRYPQHKRRVSILRQENQGLSQARNNGIDHAEGNYIGFLDSDDVLLEGYFSILGRLLNLTWALSSVCQPRLSALAENCINQAVFTGSFCTHKVITISVFGNLLNRLTSMMRQQTI